MMPLNLAFLQNLDPEIIIRYIILLFIVFYLIFAIIVVKQISSMKKIIDQPSIIALHLFAVFLILAALALFVITVVIL